MYYQETKKEAIRLRKDGYSYTYIRDTLKVPKSTLSDWLHNIKFIPNKVTLETIGRARIESGKYKNNLKKENINKANLQAEKDIGTISNRDIMMLGLGIYIGEGGKTAGLTRLINSDPKIIRLAIKWFKFCFNIKMKNLTLRLHLYPDNDINKSINYWSKETKIPKEQFTKTIIDNRTDKKDKKRHKLPFGTAHLSIKSFGDKELGVYLHRRIMAWINKVL
jgi:hypothetical protein